MERGRQRRWHRHVYSRRQARRECAPQELALRAEYGRVPPRPRPRRQGPRALSQGLEQGARAARRASSRTRAEVGGALIDSLDQGAALRQGVLGHRSVESHYGGTVMRSEGLVIIAAIVAAFLVGWQAARWEPEQQQAERLDSERFFCEPGPSIWIADPNG